jgi:copper chaperone CopZ
METSQPSRLNLLTGASVTDATADAGGCCGGGSCMCGGGAAAAPAFDLSGSRGLVDVVDTADDTTVPAGTEFLVTGMTCGHCVSSVKEEVGAIDAVDAVEVVLKKGGASRVTVSSSGPVDVDAVRAAVEEAGYQLA